MTAAQAVAAAPVERLWEFGVVPVVALDSVEHGLRVAEALCAGGLPVVEITFRTPAAAAVITALTREFPDVLVGAGTLLRPADVAAAAGAGAAFGVAPGLHEPVVAAASSARLPFVPGVCTPSELESALSLGFGFVKFFPAEIAGGVRMLDALSGPYRSARFMPTGGIRPELLADYLDRPNVIACGGTWIASPALVAAGDYAEIRRRAQDTVDCVEKARPEATSNTKELTHGA